MEMRETSAAIALPFERPLYSPPFKPSLASAILTASGEEIDASALFAVRLVDKAALTSHIRHSLRDASQVTLRQLVQSRPPEHGLAEIVAYLELAHTSFTITVDESTEDVLEWSSIKEDGSAIHKSARLPRVIFVR
jgi:hypothetical protein